MSSIQCPQCSRTLPSGSEKSCPSCGSPLLWDNQAVDGEGEADSDVRWMSDERVDDTRPLPAQAKVDTPPPLPEATPAAPPTPPSLACPACLEPNPATRVLCQRCGALLRAEQAPPLSSQPPERTRRWLVALTVLAVAAVGGVAAVVLAATLRSDGQPSPATATTAHAATTPVRVDPRSITARASSELPAAHGLTYSIRNTLDGDTHTAWNNHSAVRGSGVGETLTYRFARPLHLVRIELMNGYAKTTELYAANGRIRGVAIVTDRRILQATLSDTAHRQRLNRDFGVTRTVTLRVRSIYPGARYTDLALTEIAFWTVPR